ncbi:hypothetical protein VYU27_005112 [Nannochloropsis oceanica]
MAPGGKRSKETTPACSNTAQYLGLPQERARKKITSEEKMSTRNTYADPDCDVDMKRALPMACYTEVPLATPSPTLLTYQYVQATTPKIATPHAAARYAGLDDGLWKNIVAP